MVASQRILISHGRFRELSFWEEMRTKRKKEKNGGGGEEIQMERICIRINLPNIYAWIGTIYFVRPRPPHDPIDVPSLEEIVLFSEYKIEVTKHLMYVQEL